MSEGITYQELTRLIGQLNKTKSSGTLFLRTADNHSSMILFTAGIVTGVTCGLARGRKAISKLRGIDRFSFRFAEGRPPPIRQDLSSPEETLRELGVGAVEIVVSEGKTDSTHSDMPQPIAMEESDEAADLDLGMERIIRGVFLDHLSELLGPASDFILASAIEEAGGISTSRQIERVISGLVAEMGEVADSTYFAGKVRARIDNLFTKTACEMITGQLLEYVGPAAGNVCGDVIQSLGGHIQSPHQLERLITLLSEEIGDEQEASEFIERIREVLTHLTAS